MSSLDERIAQFEHMAAEDPDNDMAHFSLGSAYLQAQRPAEAARSLRRCIELNAGMSKAYQLAGQALLDAGDEAGAVELLEQGYEVAAGKGDVMPKSEIGAILTGLGRPLPDLGVEVEAAAERLKQSGAFVCQRTGRPGTKLPDPPMRGPVGQWIYDNIAAETWQDWIGQGTKVINELRLDFSREEDQDVYDQHMRDYLGIDAELYEQLTSKPAGQP